MNYLIPTWSLIFSLFSFVLYSQEVEVYQIVPQWKTGDIKTVTTTSKTTTYVKDSVFSVTEVSGVYRIQVKEFSEHYEFFYSHSEVDMDLSMSLDLGTDAWNSLINSLQEKISNFEFIIIVDKETVLATSIKNEDEFMNFAQKVANESLSELTFFKDKSADERKQLEQTIADYYKQNSPELIQTTINSVNYLLQAYSYPFSTEEEILQDVLTYDVNAMGYFGTTEFPATYFISAVENETELKLNIELEYDKNFLFEQMKKRSESMKEISIKDVTIKETEEIYFDIESSWINKHISHVYFEIPGVKVVEDSVITFK